MNKRLLFRIALLLYLLLVSYLLFADFSQVQTKPWTLWGIPKDKLVHFLMFLPFPPATFLAFKKDSSTPLRTLLYVLLIFAIGCALAAVSELIQGTTEYRGSDPLDFIADTVSLAVSSLFTYIIRIRFLKNKT